MTSFGEHVTGTACHGDVASDFMLCKKVEVFDNSSAMSEEEI